MPFKQLLSRNWAINLLFLSSMLVLGNLYLANFTPLTDFQLISFQSLAIVFLYGLLWIHNLYILPLFKKKGWMHYALFWMLWMGVATAGLWALRTYGLQMSQVHWFQDGIFAFVSWIFGLGIYLVYSKSSFQTSALQHSLLLREKEIQYLQGQLNPHFFFNTLNNLYGVSLRYPNKTPELLLSISELVRYQLESSRKQMVSLADELQFIRNYVHLERARVRQRCQVIFRKKGTEKDLIITPLILITFVENAFKFAPSSIQSSFIKVELEIRGNELCLRIRNTIPNHHNPVASTGVGLVNVKKRLNLTYPGKHQLQMFEEKDVYHMELKITLEKDANLTLSNRGR